MQIESEESQVGGKGGSGLSISLHPLVIINISDHSTRFQCLNGGKMKRVLGVLLGKLDGRSVEVCNSFEISYKEVDGKIKYDKDYFEVKQEQCASCSGSAALLPSPHLCDLPVRALLHLSADAVRR